MLCSAERVEGVFRELRVDGVLRSSFFVSGGSPSGMSFLARDTMCSSGNKERGAFDVSLSLEEKIRLLAMVDVFEALSEEDLEKLARLARDAAYERGEDLPEPKEGGEKL
jgi:hypothetical protein